MAIAAPVESNMTHFSLDTVKAGWRRQYWQETFDAIHPLSTASVANDAKFYGQVSWRRVGTLLLCDISAGAQRIRRLSQHVQQDDREVIEVNLQLAGETKLIQDGRECITRPGQIGLYDSSRPYEMFFDGPFRILYINFPRKLFRARFGQTENVTARAIDGNAVMGRFLSGFIKTLILQSQMEDELFCDHLQSQFIELLLAAVAELPVEGNKTVGFSRSKALTRAKTYIIENLGAETLSPVMIAAQLGVSRRYLYELFADEGTPVAHWIRNKRLEHCRADIENPAMANRPLSDIAFSWGFNDAAHFSRAFRSCYGMSPKESRAEMRKNAPMQWNCASKGNV